MRMETKSMSDNVVRSHDTTTCDCWVCKKIRIDKGFAAPVAKEDKENHCDPDAQGKPSAGVPAYGQNVSAELASEYRDRI